MNGENPLTGVWIGFLVIVAAGVLVLGIQVFRQVKVNSTALTALCALRAGEQASYQASVRFLAENPEGIPGIPVQLIKDGQARQKRTIDSLQALDC